jgi:DNA-binding CsgD family transcriptional regulator
MVDSEYVKKNICPEKDNFRKNFINLHRGDDENIYLDTEESLEKRKKQIVRRIIKNFNGINEKSIKMLKNNVGMTHREIADILEISINKVHKLLLS